MCMLADNYAFQDHLGRLYAGTYLRKRLQGSGHLEQQQHLICLNLGFCLPSCLVLFHHHKSFAMATPLRAEGPSTSSQFEQLLSAIRGMEANVDTKLSTMHKELREERETAYEHLVKKICLDSKPTFRKRGHEKQFLLNEQVQEQFEVIDSTLK